MSLPRYLLVTLLAVAHGVHGQVVGSLEPTVSSESFFLYEVKLIDEFIERFNDEPGSYIRTQSKALLGTDSMITRPRLLRSLFDKKKQWHGTADSFTQEVCALNYGLEFTNSTWYARAVCLFMVDGKKVTLPVIMHIVKEKDGAKWMIAGVDAALLPPINATLGPSRGKADFIPTSACGTGFLYLQYVFEPESNPANYFDSAALASQGVQRFLALIHGHRARFSRVTDVSYHFFGIPGWAFTVAQLKRKETNSGWLITELKRATPLQIQAQLKMLIAN